MLDVRSPAADDVAEIGEDDGLAISEGEEGLADETT